MNLRNRILEAIDNGISKSLIDFGNNKILKSEYVDSDNLKNAFDDWYYTNNISNIELSDYDDIPDDLEFPYDLFDKLFMVNIPIIKIDTKKELKVLIKLILLILGTDVNLNWIDTINITDMSSLFYFSDFSGDVSKWRVDNVTNMDKLFWNCQEFNCDLSNWHVDKVTSMAHMFEECRQFNSDVSNWHVDKVTNMDSMFNNCSLFNCDLSKWHVNNVTDMSSMFYNCWSFNCDLSNWHVDQVTNMNSMFSGCRMFNCDLSNWHVDNVTDMHNMFSECKKFNCDISNWHVDQVTDMFSMFSACDSFTCDISNWKFKNCRNMNQMFFNIGDNVSTIIEILNKMSLSKNYIKKSINLFTRTLSIHVNTIPTKKYDEAQLLRFISDDNKSYSYEINFINKVKEYTDRLILNNYDKILKNIKSGLNEKITKATNAILILRKNRDITNNYIIKQTRTGAYKIGNDDTEITISVSGSQIYYNYVSFLSFKMENGKYYYHGNQNIFYPNLTIQDLDEPIRDPYIAVSPKKMFNTTEELVDSLMAEPWFNFPWTEYEEI